MAGGSGCAAFGLFGSDGKSAGAFFDPIAQFRVVFHALLEFAFFFGKLREAFIRVYFDGRGDSGAEEDPLRRGLGEKEVVGGEGVLVAELFGQGNGAAEADAQGGVFHDD